MSSFRDHNKIQHLTYPDGLKSSPDQSDINDLTQLVEEGSAFNTQLMGPPRDSVQDQDKIVICSKLQSKMNTQNVDIGEVLNQDDDF